MSDGTDLKALGEWVTTMTRHLSPVERKALARRIGTTIRASDARRVKRNVTPPDDAPMAPRKATRESLKKKLVAERGKVRRGLMFRKASQARYLRVANATADRVEVGFVGRMARIMRVHQEGLKDHVSREPTSPEVKYPERRVLGFTRADSATVMEMVVEQLTRD